VGAAAIMMQAPAPAIHAVERLAAYGPSGTIALRLYRPTPEHGLPLVMFFHGGGFVLGGLDSHEALCRELALRSGGLVLAVDYRLAPETQFPGSLEDCHAALVWAASNSNRLGADPCRIALAGDSAGANLALATALLARNRGPALSHLALIYPMTDAAAETASSFEFGRGHILTSDAIRWFWKSYLRVAADAVNPLVSVLRADLTGLPPTTVATAEFDPLRDEGEALAGRLQAAGVRTVARRYLGMIHGFVGMGHLTPVAAQALDDVARDLAASLSVPRITSP
jgi:acetyl esterase